MPNAICHMHGENLGNSRSGHLFCQLLMKPVQPLQSLQARHGTPILNAVTEKGRQDLDLQPGQKARRKSPDHRREIRHGFPAQNRVFIVDILAQRLDHVNQASFFRFDIYLVSSYHCKRSYHLCTLAGGTHLRQLALRSALLPPCCGPRPAETSARPTLCNCNRSLQLFYSFNAVCSAVLSAVAVFCAPRSFFFLSIDITWGVDHVGLRHGK